MKLKVKNDGIVFGTNILDIKIPSKLRERYKCGIDYMMMHLVEKVSPRQQSRYSQVNPGQGKLH